MGHDPRLDGLRGIAILLVVFTHGGHRLPLDGLPGAIYRAAVDMGWSGVDLFFVLSGFLITGILLHTRGSPGSLRNFYARRTLRIFPIYYLWLVFILLLAPRVPFFAQFGFGIRGGASSLWYWFYLSNFAVALHGVWLHPVLSLTWSLAIEEQFYAVWPWVARALPPRRLLGVCLGCIVFAPLLRSALTLFGANPLLAFVLTPCRFDALAAGAFVAILSREPGGTQTLLRRARQLLPLSGVTLLLVVLAIQQGWVPPGARRELVNQPLMQTVGYSALALFFGCVLVFAAFGDARPTRFFAFAPLRVFGKYSYAMYLTHTFVGGLFVLYVFDPHTQPGLVRGLVSYALEWSAQLGVAMLSFLLVERHFLKLKHHFGGSAPTR